MTVKIDLHRLTYSPQRNFGVISEILIFYRGFQFIVTPSPHLRFLTCKMNTSKFIVQTTHPSFSINRVINKVQKIGYTIPYPYLWISNSFKLIKFLTKFRPFFRFFHLPHLLKPSPISVLIEISNPLLILPPTHPHSHPLHLRWEELLGKRMLDAFDQLFEFLKEDTNYELKVVVFQPAHHEIFIAHKDFRRKVGCSFGFLLSEIIPFSSSWSMHFIRDR